MQLISLRINIDSEEKKSLISSILELEANMPFKFWGFEINDEESGVTNPIGFFYEKMISKLDKLKAIGVTNDDITVWVLYEYDQQCNLEFGQEEINNLKELGATLCISCWQK